jgi:hypothetical protein
MMLIDHEELMKWAQSQAPLKPLGDAMKYRRYIRLEVGSEFVCNPQESGAVEGVVARAYIREDCYVGTWNEQAPLAEKRVD